MVVEQSTQFQTTSAYQTGQINPRHRGNVASLNEGEVLPDTTGGLERGVGPRQSLVTSPRVFSHQFDSGDKTMRPATWPSK